MFLRDWILTFTLLIFLGLASCAPTNPYEAEKNAAPNDIPRGFSSKVEVSPAPASYCHQLKLPMTEWPVDMGPADRAALALAMTITGNFEGPDQWANLSGDFDGQGLSLGLLNQNLGSGSLQPLLIQLRDNYYYVLKRTFNADRLQELSSMLSQWQSETFAVANKITFSFQDRFESAKMTSSSREQWDQIAKANTGSVAWARSQFSKGEPHSEWKEDLQKLARTKPYVQIQIAGALDIHRKVLNLMAQLGLSQLRSYLFLFDVFTQNGGVYDSDISDYNDYVSENSQAGEQDRLGKLLSLRLRHVRPEFAGDVKARKTTLINGSGTVHGQIYNLEKDFCYSSDQSYSPPSSENPTANQ